MLNRRSFLGFLAALPVVGWMFRSASASEPVKLPCTFVRYVATTEPPYRVAKSLVGFVNSQEFLGQPPRSVMCSEMRYSEDTPGMWTIHADFRQCQADIVCVDGKTYPLLDGIDFTKYDLGRIES